jgi:hypothetical protein
MTYRCKWEDNVTREVACTVMKAIFNDGHLQMFGLHKSKESLDSLIDYENIKEVPAQWSKFNTCCAAQVGLDVAIPHLF